MSPLWVEAGAVLVLLVFVRLSAEAQAGEVAAVAVGAWAGEEICIRVYTAYQYAPGWTVFLDRVPLAIVLIWPAVVLSARAVQRVTGVPAGLVVLYDACLIEPIATHAGLWSWSLPGGFGVPPIGPVGWACYAAAACWLLDLRGPAVSAARGAQRAAAFAQVRAAVMAPLIAHAGILAAFWGALRWVQAEIPALAAVAASTCAGVLAALLARRRPRLPWREAIPRAAAACIFAGLLLAAPDRMLLLYAAPFALPWLSLLDWRLSSGAVAPGSS